MNKDLSKQWKEVRKNSSHSLLRNEGSGCLPLILEEEEHGMWAALLPMLSEGAGNEALAQVSDTHWYLLILPVKSYFRSFYFVSRLVLGARG